MPEPALRRLLRELVLSKSASYERKLGASLRPLLVAVRLRVEADGRAFGGSAKEKHGVSAKYLLQCVRAEASLGRRPPTQPHTRRARLCLAPRRDKEPQSTQVEDRAEQCAARTPRHALDTRRSTRPFCKKTRDESLEGE